VRTECALHECSAQSENVAPQLYPLNDGDISVILPCCKGCMRSTRTKTNFI